LNVDDVWIKEKFKKVFKFLNQPNENIIMLECSDITMHYVTHLIGV